MLCSPSKLFFSAERTELNFPAFLPVQPPVFKEPLWKKKPVNYAISNNCRNNYTDINDAISVRLFVTCYVQRLRELCGAKITVVQVLVIAGGKFSTFPMQTHKGLASKQRCACVWNTTRKKPQQIQRAASRSVQTATSAQAVLSFARSV